MADGWLACVFVSMLTKDFKKGKIREHKDVFQLPDEDFKTTYGLSKDAVQFLVNELRQDLEPASMRRTCLSAEIKVLSALRFFLAGSCQKDIADDCYLPVSQSAVSRTVAKVSQMLSMKMVPRFVKFPSSEHSQNAVKELFRTKMGAEGIVGAIGSFYVPINAPTNIEYYPSELYLNSAGFHSLHVQLVCDPDTRILNISTKSPGSFSSADVWRNSQLHHAIQRGEVKLHGVLIGGHEYDSEEYVTTSGFSSSSRKHRTALRAVHRCITALKCRFRCLQQERLCYHPVSTARIVNACAVLHNLCLIYNIDPVEYSIVESDPGSCSDSSSLSDDD